MNIREQYVGLDKEKATNHQVNGDSGFKLYNKTHVTVGEKETLTSGRLLGCSERTRAITTPTSRKLKVFHEGAGLL